MLYPEDSPFRVSLSTEGERKVRRRGEVVGDRANICVLSKQVGNSLKLRFVGNLVGFRQNYAQETRHCK